MKKRILRVLACLLVLSVVPVGLMLFAFALPPQYGDTFLGAVLSRLARRPGGPLEDLFPAELEEILSFANHAAALTCSRSGAIPAMPTLAELEGFGCS